MAYSNQQQITRLVGQVSNKQLSLIKRQQALDKLERLVNADLKASEAKFDAQLSTFDKQWEQFTRVHESLWDASDPSINEAEVEDLISQIQAQVRLEKQEKSLDAERDLALHKRAAALSDRSFTPARPAINDEDAEAELLLQKIQDEIRLEELAAGSGFSPEEEELKSLEKEWEELNYEPTPFNQSQVEMAAKETIRPTTLSPNATPEKTGLFNFLQKMAQRVIHAISNSVQGFFGSKQNPPQGDIKQPAQSAQNTTKSSPEPAKPVRTERKDYHNVTRNSRKIDQTLVKEQKFTKALGSMQKAQNKVTRAHKVITTQLELKARLAQHKDQIKDLQERLDQLRPKP